MEYSKLIVLLIFFIIVINFEKIKDLILPESEEQKRAKILKQAEQKWNGLQKEIDHINQIYEKFYGEQKSDDNILKNAKHMITNIIDNHITKETKKTFEEDKLNYDSVKNYFIDNNIILPNESQKIENKIDKINRVLYVEKYIDKDLEENLQKYNQEHKKLVLSGELLHETKLNSIQVISKSENLINNISNKPKEFEKEISEIEINKKEFKTVLDFGEEQKEELDKIKEKSMVGVTTGALVAVASPKVAMWVATTFGKASTGVAISSLKGAAARNAALAWLGRGSLAMGGKGIAGGNALLGLFTPAGVGVSAATAIGAAVYAIASKNKKLEEKKDYILNVMENTKNVISSVEKIKFQEKEILELSNKTNKMVNIASKLSRRNYLDLNIEEKKLLGSLVNNTNSLSKKINMVVE